jgi:tetratricopeptide (TPR) repeat protein
VYGHPDRAEKVLAAATTAETKATYNASYADLLWRTGQPDEARERYQAARAIAVTIVDPVKRKRVLAGIDVGLRFVGDPPPQRLSVAPHPSPRFSVQDSPFPLFPITADGFQEVDPQDTSARASANGELLKQLYERAATGDRAGIESIVEGAPTPFQKALGLAALEHILIQERQPELAELYARRMQETDSPSSLAKAEALSSAAVAWLRERNDERARAGFDSAARLVSLVPDLPLGKISVLLSIAAAQCKGGMVEEGNATFRKSIELARKLPLRPRVAFGAFRPLTPLGVHYEDEAFTKILRAAIHARAFQVVDEAAAIWTKSGDDAGSTVVSAWFVEGHTDEAIAAARRIEDPQARVSELLSLAGSLLDEAGAPSF